MIIFNYETAKWIIHFWLMLMVPIASDGMRHTLTVWQQYRNMVQLNYIEVPVNKFIYVG